MQAVTEPFSDVASKTISVPASIPDLTTEGRKYMPPSHISGPLTPVYL